jgi:nicotinamide mononucleotide adenylyltransferase
MTGYAVLEPLIRRKVFADEQVAVREITRDYVRHQVEGLIREIRGFERKYGMSFDRACLAGSSEGSAPGAPTV